VARSAEEQNDICIENFDGTKVITGSSKLLSRKMRLISVKEVPMGKALPHWGMQLYQTMTGRRIIQAFDELLITQWLSRDELYALQRQKLQNLVTYADQYVPYYQRLFKEIDFEPADLKKDPDCFRQIPVVSKSCIRDKAKAFITTDPVRRRTLQTNSTSGSTGHPLIFWEGHCHRD
jgi:hypothetical protein